MRVQNILDAMCLQEETAGEVRLYQDARIDTLFSRRLITNKQVDGIYGYRVQIYRGSGRKARNEAIQMKADFIDLFPEARVYLDFDYPNYKVKVGDFRNRKSCYPFFIKVKQSFPNAYMVSDLIKYPELEVKDE